MVEIDHFDLEDIAFAPSDQDVYDEHVHVVDPATGEIVAEVAAHYLRHDRMVFTR